MPYVEGRQVASAIKKASPRTPVILLTGWGTVCSRRMSPPECVDRIPGKPPKLTELRRALADLSFELRREQLEHGER